MASSRKPRLSIGPASAEGTSFDGAFAGTDPAPAPATFSDPSAPVGPARPVRRAATPEQGEPAYERIVQGNWNVPSWMRAKIRAAAEEGGTSQNDLVQEALRRFVEDAERGRGGAFALEARHFGRPSDKA